MNPRDRKIVEPLVVLTATVLVLMACLPGLDAVGQALPGPCNSQTYGCSAPAPPPCANNTQCTAFALLNTTSGASYPCPNGSTDPITGAANLGTYYTSSNAVTAWNRCQSLPANLGNPSCMENYLYCMLVTLNYPSVVDGTCVPCGNANLTSCSFNFGAQCVTGGGINPFP